MQPIPVGSFPVLDKSAKFEFVPFSSIEPKKKKGSCERDKKAHEKPLKKDGSTLTFLLLLGLGGLVLFVFRLALIAVLVDHSGRLAGGVAARL